MFLVRFFIFGFAAIVNGLPVVAQESQVFSDRDSFLSSVVLKAQIDQCAKRVPELSDELYQAFENWKEQNRLAITRGEAIVRTEWSKAPPSYDDRLQRLASVSARLFDSVTVPDKDILDKCVSLLSK